MVDLLGPADAFGLVTFAAHATSSLPLTRMDAGGKAAARAAIAATAAGGNTALDAGVTMALDMFAGPGGASAAGTGAAGTGAAERTQYVLLLTDGHANVGRVTRRDIAASVLAAVGHLADADAGTVTISTFGFGADADAALLQDIATAAAGMYYFVDSPAAIPIAFAEALGEAMTVALRDVVLEVTCVAAASMADGTAESCARIAAVHVEAGLTLGARGSSARVAIGSMAAGARRDVLYSVTLPALAAPAPSPAAVVTLTLTYARATRACISCIGRRTTRMLTRACRYTLPSGERRSAVAAACVSRPPAAAVQAHAAADADLAVQRVRVGAAAALRAAAAAGGRGELAAGRCALAARSQKRAPAPWRGTRPSRRSSRTSRRRRAASRAARPSPAAARTSSAAWPCRTRCSGRTRTGCAPARAPPCTPRSTSARPAAWSPPAWTSRWPPQPRHRHAASSWTTTPSARSRNGAQRATAPSSSTRARAAFHRQPPQSHPPTLRRRQDPCC